MRWTARPERREIILVILSLAVYFFAYNLDTLGVDGGMARKILYKTTGFGKTNIIGPDGRKPPGWRDSLETAIFGDWVWDEGHVVGHFRERSQPVVTSRHGASWLWRKNTIPPSEESVHNALQRWGKDIPQTNVVKHVPGELLAIPKLQHYSLTFYQGTQFSRMSTLSMVRCISWPMHTRAFRHSMRWS